MNTESVHVHKTALNVPAFQKSYGEGSSVWVRVLKNNGGGKFTVSFGGDRFLISSEIPLKEGEAFSARIKLDGSHITLMRELESGVQKATAETLRGLFDSEGRIVDAQLASYFEKLGMFPDSLNYSLFQTLKSLSLPFSHATFLKARKLAAKFPGNQVEAGKAALVLIEKGIEPDEDSVSAILYGDGDGEGGASGDSASGGSDGDSAGGGAANGGNRNDFGDTSRDGSSREGASGGTSQDESGDTSTANSTSSSGDTASALFKDFFSSLFLISEKEGSKKGPLALFNHSGFKKGAISSCGSWIKIPLEYQMKKDGALLTILGEVRLFLDYNQKKVQKICGSVKFFEKNYKFVVLLNNRENKGTEKILLNEEFDIHSFRKNFPGLQAEYATDDDFLFFSDEKKIVLVDGKV